MKTRPQAPCFKLKGERLDDSDDVDGDKRPSDSDDVDGDERSTTVMMWTIQTGKLALSELAFMTLKLLTLVNSWGFLNFKNFLIWR